MPSSSLFVAVGHRGLRMSSLDGTEWSHVQTGKDGEIYRAVAFGNGRFAAVGSYGGANIFASTADGVTWETGMKDARYVTYVRGVGFGKDEFFGLGGDPGAVGDSRPFFVTSVAGKEWSEPVPVVVTQSLLPVSAAAPANVNQANDKPPASSRNLLRRFAYGNGRYVAVGDRGRRSVSLDTKEWTDVPNVKAIDTLIDVAFGNGVFVGVGLHGLRMSTTDGIDWSGKQMGEEGEHINSVIWTGDRFVAVGQGATYISADGRKWERLLNTNAPLIAVFGAGRYIGSHWRGRILQSADAVAWKEVFQAEYHVEAMAFGRGDGKTAL
jgi:hypothetical protein